MRNIVSTHSRIIGIIPDIRSYSDQWDSTIFRISILIQTWGFYYIPDIHSYSDQGVIPDIHSYSDQGVVYSFSFRPGGSTIFQISVLIQTRGGSTICRISVLIQNRGFLQYSGYPF